MNKDMEMITLIEIDVDNGYGQYIIIDDSADEKQDNTKNTKEKKNNTDYDKEYNYLTHCEHYLDYGPPLKNNMDRNTETIQKTTILNNPLVCAINHFVDWINK